MPPLLLEQRRQKGVLDHWNLCEYAQKEAEKLE